MTDLDAVEARIWAILDRYRDELGRVKRKVEDFGGVRKTFGYSYDARGRLQDVTLGGSPAEHVDYHPNDTRSGYTSPGLGSIVPVTDAQDRLSTFGPYTVA